MSEPRSSRRAKVSVNYAEPAPLSTREIRARLSQDTGEKKSRKRAPSEASAAVSLAPAPCLSSPYFLPSTSQEEDSGLESLVTTTSDSSSSSSRSPPPPSQYKLYTEL